MGATQLCDAHAEAHRWSAPALIIFGEAAANGNATGAQKTAALGVTQGPDYDYIYQGFRFPGWLP